MSTPWPRSSATKWGADPSRLASAKDREVETIAEKRKQHLPQVGVLLKLLGSCNFDGLQLIWGYLQARGKASQNLNLFRADEFIFMLMS